MCSYQKPLHSPNKMRELREKTTDLQLEPMKVLKFSVTVVYLHTIEMLRGDVCSYVSWYSIMPP